MRRGQPDLANTAARPASEPTNVVRDFEQTHRDRLQVPARFHDRVLRALRFEMVHRFAEFDRGPLFEVPHHFAGKFLMPV